ncbi:uncharacterized protein LOC108907222 [Anoplophora glabripennis]|uniref:uncharacterized protein LOC108907222 n=2 Tax=Anoplophora glabripennis TaxID=217634 RepID=UPI000875A264|nr:uncharacterized protein LOC108907222 [Anoplophora glabripennis]
MEEDDHDELLQCTDDESLSDTEDQCLPIDKPEENYRHTLTYFCHTKLEFITTKLALIFSTSVMLILFPLYLEAINVRGSAYSMILTNTSISTLLFVVTMVIAKCFCEKYRNIRICSFPVQFSKLLQLSGVYFLCAFMIVYALDRKRVICHLQDPIKGIVLVFSLLYYFFFCRKLMGLQRIFSATTIIVGLFIAVDYGLCDEFRCRGYEREKVSDDMGAWSWQTHAIWTTIYIAGLAMFAGYFTLLDRYVLTNNEMEFHNISIPSTFLSTVSRSVSFPNTNNVGTSQFIGGASPENSHLTKKNSVVHLAMWIHILGLAIILLLFWVDFIPAVGKGSDIGDFWNYTLNGFICHFQKPIPPSLGKSPCGNVFLFSWMFMCSYVLFVVMSVKFLILSQSAVYTIATMSTSLPLVGIWWSLFHAVPDNNGLMVWSPSLTGELICAILGLPIILVGLFLLCKAHFKDYQWSRLSTTHVMPGNHFA